MTTGAVDGTTRSAEDLRNAMVESLKEPDALGGLLLSPRVEQALRAVPRHRFAPEATLEEAYEPFTAVVTKRDEHGISLSSVSAPQVQAMMLEQARIEPGMKVLEVGSGGYNAALMAELVGDSGDVVTVDIDPDVTSRTRRLLAETGYERVHTLHTDAEDGVSEHAPWDRIIVTAGAWDIPPAWISQLAEHGRLVVPLRTRSLTRSIGFARHGDHLVSDSALVCGFVPMQGTGAHDEQLLLVRGTGEIGLRFDDGLPVNPHLLDNAVRTPRAEAWTGVKVEPREPIGTLQLYLATMLPGFCVMAVDPDLDTGLVEPNHPSFSMAAVEDGNFAYLLTRRTDDGLFVEYGVHAFGPQGAEFAEKVAAHLRAWSREQRGGPGPLITVFPADTLEERLLGDTVIDKEHSRVVFSWPAAK
ncbi:methyltransferase, FxLD system [Nocardiopsis sp. EMB25]|uniref:methyltransferase, FxLD system n=1 Tax=Nocardiopsis sp. EMB25 TaxID=2835867 RepID=UPI00228511F2|nr:methyltransferase, FxLD system [Nocardiopsis sp. EMB25]MCY9784960.1 methyltransferase, FxLD system [Nocardiopsis sp. EMB25]